MFFEIFAFCCIVQRELNFVQDSLKIEAILLSYHHTVAWEVAVCCVIKYLFNFKFCKTNTWGHAQSWTVKFRGLIIYKRPAQIVKHEERKMHEKYNSFLHILIRRNNYQIDVQYIWTVMFIIIAGTSETFIHLWYRPSSRIQNYKAVPVYYNILG